MSVNTITGSTYTLYSTTDAAGASSGGSSSLPPISGRYYAASGFTATTRLLSSGAMYVLPFYVGTATTLTSIGVEVTTVGAAGSTVRLGIYAGSPPSGSPVLDAGTVVGDVLGAQETAISVTLQPGLYWLACRGESAGTYPTLRALTGTSSFVGGSTAIRVATGGLAGYSAGAQPAGPLGTFPAAASGFDSTGNVPNVVVKVA